MISHLKGYSKLDTVSIIYKIKLCFTRMKSSVRTIQEKNIALFHKYDDLFFSFTTFGQF